ncbi:hypothetical protein AVEN_6225-1, partial [Araneus ventricosus]
NRSNGRVPKCILSANRGQDTLACFPLQADTTSSRYENCKLVSHFGSNRSNGRVPKCTLCANREQDVQACFPLRASWYNCPVVSLNPLQCHSPRIANLGVH